MITEDLIHEAQKKWGDAIVKIGSLKDNESECIKYTTSFLNEIYDFKNNDNDLLFKPTKASVKQFRPTLKMALSYFLGGDDSFCEEDDGFAMKPWVEVKFENAGFIIDNDRAIAMGNYFFTDLEGIVVKVEYTFGYKLRDGNLVIDLHHSSFPFSL